MAAKKPKTAKKPAPAAKKTARAKKPAAGRKPAAGATRARPAPAVAPLPRERPPLLEALYAEHRHIASVMQLFREQLEAIAAGQLVDTHVVYEVMDYMVTWPDRFHHPREDLIYGRVAELDAGAADSVDSLQRDHDAMAETAREVLRNIRQWRDGEVSGEELVRSGRAYIDHMYEHMNTEEKLVFPEIDRVLGAEDWRELAQDDQLRPVADPVFGPRVQREFRNMARKLRSSVRRGVERGTLVEWLSVEAVMESLEVVSMAYESARGSAAEHARVAWDEGVELFRESAVTAPWRCAANNARLGLRLIQEVAEISRQALGDISRVNQERKARIRLMDS
ncbi:MAG: hemerythrin domain-containing protein [Gammaproteobacteria bacterium]|nr:hemerythrin domain-containing protein [Gammaproteobacteria bacterium]MDH5172603.1 hemerythrin domain-containing protein [Gammaproteobacteria bacterium]